MRRTFWALALSIVAAGSALSAPLEDGVAAVERGDLEAAVRLLAPLAAQGNIRAMRVLAVAYHNAQQFYEATRWFRSAATRGDMDAQHFLGQAYEVGLGVPQDYAAAVEWYLAAAEQGEPVSQRSLGRMYEAGRGIPQNLVQAHMWFNLAASRLRRDTLGISVFEDRERVAARMTPDQITEAQRLAREWDAAHPRRDRGHLDANP